MSISACVIRRFRCLRADEHGAEGFARALGKTSSLEKREGRPPLTDPIMGARTGKERGRVNGKIRKDSSVSMNHRHHKCQVPQAEGAPDEGITSCLALASPIRFWANRSPIPAGWNEWNDSCNRSFRMMVDLLEQNRLPAGVSFHLLVKRQNDQLAQKCFWVAAFGLMLGQP
jgi:hypothetical protein